MEEIWARIDAWLKVNAPVVFHSLQPGASDSQIQAVEHALSVQFPEDVRAFYCIHNGQSTVDYGAHGLIPLGREFLCLERIQEEWQINEEVLGMQTYNESRNNTERGIRTDFWNRRWIPLTSDGGGDHECLDLDPDEGGAFGQVISWMHDDDTKKILAPSFRSWLEDYATKLESGEYVFSKEYDGIVTLEFLEYSKQLDVENERKKSSLPSRSYPVADTVVTAKSVTIGIYDGWKYSPSREAPPEDKDEITITLNGETILPNILLDSTKQPYTIELAPGVNTITLTVVRANPAPLVMPFITIDESSIYRGKSEYQFGFSESLLSASFTMSYLPD